MAFTQIIACQFLQTDSGVLLRDSTPQELLTASPKAALEWLTEEREHVLRVLWDLDSEVAPLLKLLGKDFCQTLHDKGEAILRPYRVKYIPNKLFSIMNMDMGYLAEFYNLSQFLPTYPAPDSLEQLYYWGRMVHKTFHDIGMEATRMVSPANIFDSNVLDRLNVPTWRDLPPEICEYAMFCSKRQWIEAVQLGYWPETYDFDLSSAYSSRMINLIDHRYCDWFTYKDHIPPNAVYGYFNCEVSIPRSVKLHPIITYVNNIPTTPTGDHLQMYLSLDRINFIAKHSLGTVKIIDGYYALMKSPDLLDAEKHPMTYPLRIIIPRLLSKRTSYNPVKDLLVKVGVNSMIGKMSMLVERKGQEVLGDHANPVWSEKIVTATCLDVADFIYCHQLTDNVLHISIDGFLSDKPVLLMDNDIQAGWKEPYVGPALIISSGRLFLGKKRPGGLTLETALELINSDPDNIMWQTTADRKVTLAEALKNNTFDQLGQPITTGQTLHLLASHKRHFPKTPTSGQQLLAEHFPSIPFHLKSNKEEA